MKKMDETKLKAKFEKLFNDQQQVHLQLLHRVWFRNILYYLGEQWFEWVRGQNTFRRMSPSPFTPTPVSNMIRDYVRSMKSLILNKDYTVSVWPNSNDQEDREAAEMGEFLLRFLEAADDESILDEKEKISIWMILTGVAFDRTFVSNDTDAWVFDKSGNPIKTGNIVTEHVSPFSVRLDSYGAKLKQKRFVGIQSLRPLEWIEDTFKVKVSSDTNSPVINYERQLAKMVASVSPWKGDGLEMHVDNTPDDDMALFKEIEIRPCQEFPKGYYAGMVDNQIIFQYDRLPVPITKDGKWDYSITDYHYQYVPGRFWSDAGVNDLISPQNTINQIDQSLETNRKGLGQNTVLMPADLAIKKVSKFGQSINVWQYDPLLSGGAKPDFVRGMALPSQVLDERMIHRQVAQDAAGDPKNILRGSAPSSDASGIMVDILRDAAEQGHQPDVSRFYRSYKRSQRKQLVLAQEVFTEERMLRIVDQDGRAKVMKFKGSDIRGNTDLRMNLNSGAASTRAGQTNLIIRLYEQGFFNPDNGLDPEFKQEILRRMGLGSFKDKTNPDASRALEENERAADMAPKQIKIVKVNDPKTNSILEVQVIPGLFAAIGGGQEQPGLVLEFDPIFPYDNHMVHYEIHRRFIMSSQFRYLDKAIQDALMVHTDYHKWVFEDAQRKAEEAAMQKAAMMQALAQGGQEGGGPPEA